MTVLVLEDGRRLVLPGPGRWCLPGDAAPDALLAAGRQALGEASVGWIPGDGGLLANLPAWENLLLTVQWHAPAAPAVLQQRLQGWLAACGFDAAAGRALLASAPAQLSAAQCRLLGWLRMLLLRPRLLCCEPRALAVGAAGVALSNLLQEELPALVLVATGPVAGYGSFEWEGEGV